MIVKLRICKQGGEIILYVTQDEYMDIRKNLGDEFSFVKIYDRRTKEEYLIRKDWIDYIAAEEIVTLEESEDL